MNFKIIDNFRGYNSAGDNTKISPDLLIRGSKNVYKTIRGTIAVRPGVLRRGSIDSTEAGVKSSFEWSTNVGTLRPLRVCNNKLQVESDILSSGTYIWYDLLETSTLTSPATTYTRFVFDTWWDNDEKTDRLVMVRGDHKILHWSGGMAKVASSTVDTITKSGSETWAELGFATNFQGNTGVISSVSIGSNAGSGYNVGDVITVTGGGGSLGTVIVTSIGGSDSVTGIVLGNGGSGYSAGSNLTTSGGSGTNLTISVNTVITTGNEKKIIINGTEYSYTGGENSTTLTGVTGDASSLAVDSIIIQSVMVRDNVPINNFKADFCKTINNQLWVGSYSSRVVYVSADITISGTLGFLNFVNTGGLVVGDPDAVIMDSVGKGIGEKDGKVILFAGDSEMYVVTPNDALTLAQSGATSITTSGGSATRSIIQKIEKKRLPVLTSCLAHEFIDNLGEYFIWLDQKNRLRALGSFANIDSLKPVSLSITVQNELSEDDFTGGHLRVISDNDGETVYITAPNNARDWMYQVRESIDENGSVISERLWQPPQIRGVSRFAVINGVIYGHSNINPQIYQIWDTGIYSDDHTSGEFIPYSARAFFAYNSHGERTKLKTFEGIYVEGYMNEGNELNARVYYDYQGGEDTRDLIVSSNSEPASSWLGVYPPSLGDSSLGDNPLGNGIIPEGGNQDLVPKFRAILDVDQVNCFEYAIEFYSSEVDSRWEIIGFGTNVKIASQHATHIRK